MKIPTFIDITNKIFNVSNVSKLLKLLPKRATSSLAYVLCRDYQNNILDWAPKFSIKNEHVMLIAVSRAAYEPVIKERREATDRAFRELYSNEV